MPFLCKETILARLNNPQIEDDLRIDIQPPPQEVGPCSIDLTLSPQFATFRRFPRLLGWKTFDPRDPSQTEALQDAAYNHHVVTDEKGIIVRPNEIILAASCERVKLPKKAMGLITGRSSYARLGIEVHLTQDLRQPGHSGHITLQIKNNAPFSFRLYPGMRIAQLLIAELDQPCQVGYDEQPGAKYPNERNVMTTKWFGDKDLKDRPIISRLPYFKQSIEMLGLVGVVVTVVAGIQTGGPALQNTFFVTSLALTTILAIMRIIINFVR